MRFIYYFIIALLSFFISTNIFAKFDVKPNHLNAITLNNQHVIIKTINADVTHIAPKKIVRRRDLKAPRVAIISTTTPARLAFSKIIAANGFSVFLLANANTQTSRQLKHYYEISFGQVILQPSLKKLILISPHSTNIKNPETLPKHLRVYHLKYRGSFQEPKVYQHLAKQAVEILLRH